MYKWLLSYFQQNNTPFIGGYIHIEGVFSMDKYLLAQSSSGKNNISFHKGLSFAKCYVLEGGCEDHKRCLTQHIGHVVV